MKVRLHVIGGPAAGQVVELEGPRTFVVGRAAECDLPVVDDKSLSRKHCQLELDGERLVARDLESKHGMFVNQRRETAVAIGHGDRIQVGETVMQVQVRDSLPTTIPALPPTVASRAAPMPGVALVTVRCRCGVAASNEPARPGEDDVVFLCESCQATLTASPSLPPEYALVRVLGRGAMGSVCLARHTPTNGMFAVKQILPKAAMSAAMRKLFAREAAVQAQLDHPNIVRVFGAVEHEPGSFSIIMEYVDGFSGDELLREPPLEPARAVQIGIQALAGLAHAHGRGIVHRDVKEGNLMMVRDGSGGFGVKVADFGLAKNFHDSGASGMTGEGALGGTIPYMPKEQLLDFKYVKPPADLYALGATLYRLLVHAYPRDYPEGANWIRISLEQPVIPLRGRSLGRYLPESLCAVIERALAPSTAARYQTALEMQTALATLSL